MNKTTFKAWAIFKKVGGKIATIDVSIVGMVPAKMEAAAIYRTKAAANHNKADHERIDRVLVTEI